MRSKILLADDSITIQKVVNLTFSDEGIDVVAVSNGDMAERKLDEVKPDLVLADIFMPGKNGYQLCEAIKQNPQFRNVPVILLVGAFEPFDNLEARRVNADAHLTKPFESRTLVEMVRSLINASAHTVGGPVAAMTPADEPYDENGRGHETGSITSKVTSGHLPSPQTPKLDLSAMMVDANAPSSAATRNTSELSSRVGDFHAESFEVSASGASAREAITATLIDTDEPFETMEFASGDFNSEEASSPLALDADEPILDFERTELFDSPAPQTAPQEDISFVAEPAVALEVDLNETTSESEMVDSTSTAATEFDLQSVDAASTEGADTAQSNLHASQFELNVENNVGASSHNGGASLLAADEPLGDVLDETSPIEPPVGFAGTDDSLNLELNELETVATSESTRTQLDLINTPDASSSPASSEPEPFEEEHQTVSAGTMDWTSPHAGAYSTAQLDSVVMPIETANYLAQHSAKDSIRSEVSHEASFAPPTRWTEDEAQFAAIDIEAVPIDERAVELDAHVSDHSPQSNEKTGALSVTKEPANGAGAPSALSATVMDEIVRRVIAEMSDSVVREVAWEVVPDCVERVVDQLTRESMANQHNTDRLSK